VAILLCCVYVLLVYTRIGAEVVLQAPGLGDALSVWAAGRAPVTTVIASAASAIAAMSRVVVVDPGMRADIAASPGFAGECQADAPAAAAIGVFVNRLGIASQLFVA